ncbi:tRNA cytosine(34) acetyltransferase TmcA [Erwinia sp. OLTSP20]|uniref:tRNA(Met) cytidine acetyltransferase TmcA n=1 Tax=unclassified Erwinia TaxID=2622719 RepID=UPI000C175C52|nr:MULTISPECIES: GNAT family N-acetyltransferase [unclassified Erwinia]PIJ51609.1 tRNA cytosine(34) acetyltransferase TmcA [Erwinia sp. OAMSP11]PIJ68931.1 tRNA cytosine(34) acetyltransferase TmcA [Erwinia sp. OLSSP12]PIJ83520.1 tRNA cytosine(34) acetyltransferase TmcA [Erwinia sp. OLCASP19]PIJ83580.1 tRNA cytosine(34) acetyltransferase TmcA [Erwinia sp. OLMDSP33]PIJ86353.1 tRNA cytosine(34) acetyltransferase TmcA [Erwinia sp. OLMTSP26]
MSVCGIRRLAVLSGDAQWCLQQAACWQQTLPGDWLWVGGASPVALSCAPDAIRTLLGREFHHAVFDARQGFHAEAFAALAGTLRAGSWLLLLTPALESWAQQTDSDSLRWSEQPQPIATPNFIRHLCQLLSDPQVLLHQQGAAVRWPDNHAFPPWQSQPGQQQALCQQLLASPPALHVLTAGRGRGKSALAGMLVHHWPGPCWVTAPAKASTAVLSAFAGERFQFIAPDRLLALCRAGAPPQGDWLLVDEAAAIPAPVLRQLIQCFPRVLLTTTIQGYEGTGRGFVLKFCASLPGVRMYSLSHPLRWADNDPLENWLHQALIFNEPAIVSTDGELHYDDLQPRDWRQAADRLSQLYQLLCSAHYRTSPLDLRRMMDAPGQHFTLLVQQSRVQGGLWLVEEGGLDRALADRIWAGWRRPAGNLVAQSLAAHAGLRDAPQLSARRISRIAVAPALRRQGVGRRLVARAVQQAGGCDYLSVSFGYTTELAAFWQACGFQLVRIGSYREASSGCYTAMALLPLTRRGSWLTERAQRRFRDELGWLQEMIDEPELAPVARCERPPDQQDLLELAGFAFALRPFEATRAPLGRLLLHSVEAMPLLRATILQRQPAATLCQQFSLRGRRQLMARWREEAGRGLYSLDAGQAASLQGQIRLLQ